MSVATRNYWRRSVNDVTRILITGDSHTGALKRGLELLQTQGQVPEDFAVEVVGLGGGQHMIAPFFEVEHGVARITQPTFLKRFPQLPVPASSRDPTVYGWCGLFHFAKAWRDRSWIDFRPSTVAGKTAPVSMGLIQETVTGWFGQQLELLHVIRKSGARVLVIETPRPFRHHWALKRISAEVVAAVDQYCQQIMMVELQDRDIELVRMPADCTDDMGFMDPRWRHEVEADEHHGNEQFGALMIQQTCQYLRINP